MCDLYIYSYCNVHHDNNNALGGEMLRTAIEIGVVVSTIMLGGCVTTVDYDLYPINDYPVIRVHPVPHSHYYGTNRLIAYVPKPVPRRIYYYNRLWYDEPSTIIIRSKTDRVRVPNSEIKNHFNRMPKRDVSKDVREMERKKHEQQIKRRRTNVDESTRIRPESRKHEKIQGRNQQRRSNRTRPTRKRPSSGTDKKQEESNKERRRIRSTRSRR